MMDEEKFIWCRRCNEIHHITRFDRAPEYVWAGCETKEIARDDWRDFMYRHSGHKLESLRSVGEGYRASGCSADPTKMEYIRSNEWRRFLCPPELPQEYPGTSEL